MPTDPWSWAAFCYRDPATGLMRAAGATDWSERPVSRFLPYRDPATGMVRFAARHCYDETAEDPEKDVIIGYPVRDAYRGDRVALRHARLECPTIQPPVSCEPLRNHVCIGEHFFLRVGWYTERWTNAGPSGGAMGPGNCDLCGRSHLTDAWYCLSSTRQYTWIYDQADPFPASSYEDRRTAWYRIPSNECSHCFLDADLIGTPGFSYCDDHIENCYTPTWPDFGVPFQDVFQGGGFTGMTTPALRFLGHSDTAPPANEWADTEGGYVRYQRIGNFPFLWAPGGMWYIHHESVTPETAGAGVICVDESRIAQSPTSGQLVWSVNLPLRYVGYENPNRIYYCNGIGQTPVQAEGLVEQAASLEVICGFVFRRKS